MTESTLSKVPAVTLGFWIIKIAATTLGETGGDTVTMTMNLGYLVGTAIFLTTLIALAAWQIAAKRFHPFLYWATIVASTTAGTTMADFADRSLGIGYEGGSTLLLCCVLGSLGLWYWSAGTVSVNTVATPKAEAFYWITITFSQTLGTALGDWAARFGPGLWRRCAGLRRGAGAGRRRLFLDEDLARVAVLDGLYPDPAPRRDGRRFPRQAGERRRHGAQPPHRLGRDRRLYRRVHPGHSAARRHPSGLLSEDGIVVNKA